MRRSLVLVLTVACLLQPLAQELEHEWYKYYEDAKIALKAGRCDDALTFLLYSTKKRDRPGRRVQKYSGFYTEYYPYFLMAQAYFCLKKYETAEESLKKEEFYREIQKDAAAYAELQKLRAQLQTVMDAAQKPVQPTAGQDRDDLRRQLSRGEELASKGDYASARTVLQQVEKDGAAVDASLAQQAARLLADIDDREEKAWQAGQAALGSGDLNRALTELERVMEFKGRHAGEAARLRQETQNRLSGEQSFKERLADAEQFLDSGNYEAAFQAADRLAQTAGARTEVNRFRERAAQRLFEEASRDIQQGRLADAEIRVKLAEKHLATHPETAAARQRLIHWQRLAEAEQLLRDKRWSAADRVLTSLQAVPELAGRVQAAQAQVRRAGERLATDRQQAERLVTAGQTGPAVLALEALRRDYPEEDAIGARIQEIRERMRRSGTMAVEDYLRSALERFFEQGDYAQVVFYLDEYLKRNGARRDLALFFRAMARISVQRLEGGGTGYLDQARQDVARISPGFQPPRRWVSPAALALYDKWRR
jgi:hypothetical protein